MSRPSAIERIVGTSSRGAASLFVGNAVSGVISILALVLLGRLLGPDLFGKISIVMILPTIALLMQDWAVSHGIVHYVAYYQERGDFGRVRSVIIVGAAFEAMSGILLSLAALLTAEYFAVLFIGNPNLVITIRIASLFVVGQAMIALGRSILLGLDKANMYGRILVIAACLQALLPLIFVVCGYGLFGAVLGITLGSLLTGGISIGAVIVSIPPTSEKHLVDFQTFKGTLAALVGFSFPIYLAVITGGALPQLQYLIASHYLDAITIGNYSAAIRLSSFMSFVSMPIIAMLFPAFSKIGQETTRTELANFYKSGVKITAAITVPLAAFLITISEPIVLLTYGAEFSETPLYLALSIATMFNAAVGHLVVGSFLRGQKKTNVYLRIHLILLLSGLLLSVLLTPVLGVVGLLLSSILGSFFLSISAVYWIWKSYGFKPDWIASGKLLLTSVLSSLVTVVVTSIIPQPNVLVSIVLSTILFSSSFILIFAILKPFSKRDFAAIKVPVEALGKAGRLILVALLLLEKISSRKHCEPRSPQVSNMSKHHQATENLISEKERNRLEITNAFIPDGIETILDVGCFDGRLSNQLAKRHITVGMDISPALIAVKSHAVLASAEAIPFRDEAFDCVVCTEVLEHIPNPLYQIVLNEIERVSKQWILVSVPWQERLEENMAYCGNCGRAFNVWGHIRTYSIDELRHLFQCFVPTKAKLLGKGVLGSRMINEILQRQRIPTTTTVGICPFCGVESKITQQRKSIGYLLRVFNTLMKTLKARAGMTIVFWGIALYMRTGGHSTSHDFNS